VRARRHAALFVLGAGLATAAFWTADRLVPPPLDRLERTSTLVVDRQGELLRPFTTAEGTWRLRTRAADADPVYLDFLLAIEDRRFWWHPGIDPLAVLRALGQAVRHGRPVSGASTLSMQVARLLEPRPRTFVAKVIEAFRAIQLEWRLGKQGVLEAYLTLAPMGGNLEGLRAGALAWFGREPGRLSPAEAALLVALPQAPARVRPDLDPVAARRARDRILARAVAVGALDPASAEAARSAALPDARRPMPFLAAHLAERRARAVPPGARVETTLDGDLQRAVERLARAELDRLPPPVDLAILVVEVGSGAIRAWVGSGNYLDARRAGMLDHGLAVRSPGSTLKPFVYGLAFDAGIAHPATLVTDRPMRFEDWAPGNFDGGFDGDVTLREALQRSLNLPAVQLAERVGPVTLTHRLSESGIGLVVGSGAPAPNLPLILGGVGTRLVDLVHAYSALARDGRPIPPRDDPHGLGEPGPALMAPATAKAVRAILAELPRPIGIPISPRPVAYKTGTSHRYRDGWAIGFDGGHVVGIWIGRADGAACSVCNGPGTAAPILFRVMALLPEHPLALLTRDHPLGGPAPPALVRLEPGGRGAPFAGRGPRVTFPVDGSTVLAPVGAALPLRASGGEPPYRWLVDEQPLVRSDRRRETPWQPLDEGFAVIRVIDGRGRGDTVSVRVLRPEALPVSPASPSRTRRER
jgi:penicillin-binding protein 1C